MDFHCCGNNGVVDFNQPDPLNSTMLTLPASCCGQWTSDDSWKKECNITDIVYEQGCIGKLKSVLINYLVTISLISIFMLLVEISPIIYNRWKPDWNDLYYEKFFKFNCELSTKDTTDHDRINDFTGTDNNDDEQTIDQRNQQDEILAENYEIDEGNDDIRKSKVLEAMIGEGAFGTVFRGKELATGTMFAVKQIDTKGLSNKEKESLEREIKTLLIVNSQFVVQYFDYWHEFDCLYIQMELCSDSLRDILQLKLQLFNRQMGLPLNEYEYIISCELFRQILECVQYLHELNPQIIHRDLKPDNILVARKVRNGRFIKLADFGLATIHDSNIHNTLNKHTAQVGDLRFMAPEIMQGIKYNHKSDIYSLALIGGEIFDLNLSGELDSLEHYAGDTFDHCRDRIMSKVYVKLPKLEPGILWLIPIDLLTLRPNM
ncbi:unnamed protein product [Oppiella nova]|uniref:Protein kinase domain-containing protein n=1 Tax=Oppiella nova TaxID=334625 RepID=A0A7R9M605_9ACAR|nr:unnamed protein product [Oppiella nova]CAG2170883.1 unnamed protein product [Oppiella nova]